MVLFSYKVFVVSVMVMATAGIAVIALVVINIYVVVKVESVIVTLGDIVLLSNMV